MPQEAQSKEDKERCLKHPLVFRLSADPDNEEFSTQIKGRGADIAALIATMMNNSEDVKELIYAATKAYEHQLNK